MQYSVRFDTSQLRQGLASEKLRVARTVRRAANHLGWMGNQAIKDEMRTALDRPKPYTLNSTRVQYVSDEGVLAGTAEVVIDWKPEGTSKGAGRGAQKYLRALMQGGGRGMKGFEKAIGLENAFSGGARASRIAVPAKWAELDQYGNMAPGQIRKIVSYLRLNADVGYTSNRSLTRKSRGSRRGEEYFMVGVGSEHKTLSPGIYRVAHEMGGAPLMVIAFVRAASYRARFNPVAAARRIITANASTIWQQALTRTLPFRR